MGVKGNECMDFRKGVSLQVEGFRQFKRELIRTSLDR